MARRTVAVHLLFVLVAAGAGLSCGRTAPVQPRADANALVGTWRLVSLETIRPGGEALTEWMGKRPSGLIAYLPSGYMSVQIMRDPRPAVAGTTWAGTTAAEKLAAIDGYYAYFGTYVVDAGVQTVTHHVLASLRPHEVGLKYLRRFELADDRLTLTSHTFQEAGQPRFNRLVWERVR